MVFLHISTFPCLIGVGMLLVLIPFVVGHRKNKRLQAQFTVSCHDAYVGATRLLHTPGPGITACLYLTRDPLRKYEALSER